MYRQNMPGRFMQIIQSRAGVVALIQRITIGKLQDPNACLLQGHVHVYLFSLRFCWLLAAFICDRKQSAQCVCNVLDVFAAHTAHTEAL